MRRTALAMLVAATMVGTPVAAYEVNDRLTVAGVLAGVVQCQVLTRDAGANDTCDGAVPFQPEVGFRFDESSDVFFKLGFAAGNGLDEVSPFLVSAFAADVESAVTRINGRDRDYLINAWYRYRRELADDRAIAVTFGIIDATDYLDGNAYSNDEYTQFLNAALVNGPNAFLPSYDLGAALEWEGRRWSATAVYMNVGANEFDREFDFLGVQVARRVTIGQREGTYRVVADTTNERFLDPTGTRAERRLAFLVSADQEITERVGAFVRLGWQDDAAAIEFSSIYSGGVEIDGGAWGRDDDAVGVGLAYLDGGNNGLDSSRIAEVYYRLRINDALALTADVQHLADRWREESGPAGFVLGARATVRF